MKNGHNPIRFAIVGYGMIGKRHAQMIAANAETELVAICDNRPRYLLNGDDPGLPYYESLDDLLTDGPDFDVLCVATPNGLHAQHALAAIAAGKHVVIEKPMALSRADCEKILFTAIQAHCEVFCVMQNRYSPPSRWIKEMVDQGRLGEIYMVQVNCYWNRDERYYKKGGWKGRHDLDGGPLFTQFSHFIDIMYWLFGDITDIQAVFCDFNHQQLTEFEDSGMIHFRFVSGGIGSINYSTSTWEKNMESSLTVIGSQGSVKIAGQYMNEVVYCHIRDYVMPELPPTNAPNNYGSYTGSASNHNYIFENVVEVIKNRSSITTNALEGFKVVEMIERIYALRKAGKSPAVVEQWPKIISEFTQPIY